MIKSKDSKVSLEDFVISLLSEWGHGKPLFRMGKDSGLPGKLPLCAKLLVFHLPVSVVDHSLPQNRQLGGIILFPPLTEVPALIVPRGCPCTSHVL